MDVHQHAVRIEFADRGQRLLVVRGPSRNRETARTEELARALREPRVVVHDQYAERHKLRLPDDLADGYRATPRSAALRSAQ